MQTVEVAPGLPWRQRVAVRVSPSASGAAVDRAVGHGERLVSAALALIIESGDTSFTVQDAARRADVSLTTVYNYFAGKDELLLAAVEEAISLSADLLRSTLEDETDPVLRLRNACLGT